MSVRTAVLACHVLLFAAASSLLMLRCALLFAAAAAAAAVLVLCVLCCGVLRTARSRGVRRAAGQIGLVGTVMAVAVFLTLTGFWLYTLVRSAFCLCCLSCLLWLLLVCVPV